ncbi:MAG: recombinase zinc ribbon domain-containing protein [Mycobacteriales bacterium]
MTAFVGVCARCGKHYAGTSAVGNRSRYRYYTCFTRQRYVTSYCDAERLPAEGLDAAVVDTGITKAEGAIERYCEPEGSRPGAIAAPSPPQCEPLRRDRGLRRDRASSPLCQGAARRVRQVAEPMTDGTYVRVEPT